MELRSDTRDACEAAWRAGQPLKVTDDGFPILMKSSMNCRFRVKGTKDIAYVGFPDVPKEMLIPMLREFLKTIPRLTARQLENADDGIYTWIYASVDGSEPTFYASRTAAMLELGTVHYSIATAVGATSVHGAGEVKKSGERLTFNFLSGTFMQSWKLPPGCTLEIMQELLKTKLKETFPYTHRAKQLVVRTTDPTLINVQYIELTTYELDGYQRAGFVVCIHPKEATDDCKKTGPKCARPVTTEPTKEELREQMKSLGIDQMKGGENGLAVQGQRVPLTPRKAYLNREPSLPSQASLARQVFASRGMISPDQLKTAKERALASLGRPISPASVGLGRRKTKKAKTVRRKTRRRA